MKIIDALSLRYFHRHSFARAALLGVLTLIGGSVAEAATGRMPGAFSVSQSGAANYTIPIWLPPAPGGVQPSLSLAYSSASAANVMGPGWSLVGLGAIARCHRTAAQDNPTRGWVGMFGDTELASTDAYCLNGKRLRLTGGNYGSDGSTYETEITDFAQVTAHGSTTELPYWIDWTTNGGPRYFIVKAKNGWTYEYGNSPTSAVRYYSSNNTPVLSWLLNKVSDTNGNSYVVDYGPGPGGSGPVGVPTSISYASSVPGGTAYRYTILFSFVQDNLGGVESGYIADAPFANGNLLAEIKVSGQTGTLRRYALEYTPAPVSGINRLTSVKQCASDGTSDCQAPTQVNYADIQASPVQAIASKRSQQSLFVVNTADFDGDNKADILYWSGSALYVALTDLTGSSENHLVYDGIDSGYTSTVAIADLRRRGRSDIIIRDSNGVMECLYWNNTAFVNECPARAISDRLAHWEFADVNGDGFPDMVATYWSGTPGAYNSESGLTEYPPTQSIWVELRLSTSTTAAIDFAPDGFNYAGGDFTCDYQSWQCPDQYAYTFNFNGPQASAADFNGDGRADFVYAGSLLISTGSTFAVDNSLLSFGLNGASRMADIDKDGCTDVEFATTISYCRHAPVAKPPGAKFGGFDWDGDGRPDEFGSSNGLGGVILATGGFVAMTPAILKLYSPIVADFDGDGSDDVLTTDGSNFLFYRHSTAVDGPPNLATHFTDGYGLVTHVVYAMNSQGATTGLTTEETALVTPMPVVSTVTMPDGATPNGTFTLSYQYLGGVDNLVGRGFEGFQTVTTTDSRASAPMTTTTYLTAFPYTGMLSSLDIKQHDGTLISQMSYTPAQKVLGSDPYQRRYYPYVSHVTTDSREVGNPLNNALNGTLITHNDVSYSFDDHGNVTDTTSTVKDKDVTSPYAEAEWSAQTSTLYADPDMTSGCANLPKSVTVRKSAPGVADIVLNTVYPVSNLDTTHCRATVMNTQGGNREIDHLYHFDSFGNLDSETVTGRNHNGSSMTPRTTATMWDPSGRFVTRVTNAEGERVDNTNDDDTGVLLDSTDRNNVKTIWAYDSFLRRTDELRADNTSTHWSYDECANLSLGCVNGNNKLVVTRTEKNADGSAQAVFANYLDKFDRVLVSTSPNVADTTAIRTEAEYDPFGRVGRQAAPCKGMPCAAVYWTTNTYDAVGRLVLSSRRASESDGNAAQVQYDYLGRTTRVTDPLGRYTYKILTVAGDLAATQDRNGYRVSFVHDPAGSLTDVTDSIGNRLFSASYDYSETALQRNTYDIDRGTWVFEHDSLGDLTAYTNANQQDFSIDYDRLSRPTHRVATGEATTDWTWGDDRVTDHNVGLLKKVTDHNGYQADLTYDTLSRLQSRQISLGLVNPIASTYGYTYSANSGFLDTMSYPASTNCFVERIRYDYMRGQLQRVREDIGGGAVFWEANATSAFGDVGTATLGNGVVVSRTFDAVTGQLNGALAQKSGQFRENLGYAYYKDGSLKQRQDNNRGFTENFYYDNINRLEHSDFVVGATTTENQRVCYDNVSGQCQKDLPGPGNITARKDVANFTQWTYDPVKKHAVHTAGGASYDYDANGNVTSRNGNPIAWNHDDLPTEIDGTNEALLFFYGPDGQRWRQVYGSPQGSEDTYFIGDALEKTAFADGTVDWRHYIYANGEPVAIVSRRSDGQNAVRYLLDDHQGSVAMVLDEQGQPLVSESFDAFGNSRDASTWSGPQSAADQALLAGLTRRGYTFHTNLGTSALGLVHMNGRVMDATIGRFLSADPYLTEPGSTQNFNRYAYVYNSPLNYTDPSGFDAEGPELPEVTVEGYLAQCPSGYHETSRHSDYHGEYDIATCQGDASIFGIHGQPGDDPSSGQSIGSQVADTFWPGWGFGTCLYNAYTDYVYGGHDRCSTGQLLMGIAGVIPAAKAETAIVKSASTLLKVAKAEVKLAKDASAAKGAVEMHHLLPQAKRFGKFFERAGLNIEDFKIPLDKATHRLTPGGIHTKAGGDWNGVWDQFFEASPNATKDQILRQLERMRGDFGI